MQLNLIRHVRTKIATVRPCAQSALALLPFGVLLAGSHAMAQGAYSWQLDADFNLSSEQRSQFSVAVDAAGDVFGTSDGASNGGGTLWEVAAGSTTPTVLYTFPSSSSPSSGVTIDRNGNLYGTSSGSAGSGNDGTVWEYSNNALSVLATFTGSNGASPFAYAPDVTIDSSGNLYGTTELGGANNDGTVWEIPASTKVLKVLASFSNATNGEEPMSGASIDGSGNLYGTTYTGGAGSNASGTVWKIAAGTTTLTVLYTFNGTFGYAPASNVLIDASGEVYGTASAGGNQTSSYGTVWRVGYGLNASTLVFRNAIQWPISIEALGPGELLWSYLVTELAVFTGPSYNGTPTGSIAFDTFGNLFGTCMGLSGPPFQPNYGCVWELPSGGTLGFWPGAANAYPVGGVTRGVDGFLYGAGAANPAQTGDGNVWSIGDYCTTIPLSTANGEYADGIVAMDSSGNAYGTATTGGADNLGTVWKRAKGSNSISTLVTFTGTNGSYPTTNVVFDTSGNMYGATEEGGTSGAGMLWEIKSGGSAIIPLFSFNDTYGCPQGTIALDTKGNLYGANPTNGSYGFGTVWKYSISANAMTLLKTFDAGVADGGNPWYGVAVDAGGNVYGTTLIGGTSITPPTTITSGGVTRTIAGYEGSGTLWKIASNSAFAVLFDFTTTTGNGAGGITIDSSGNAYGAVGGAGNGINNGIVYEVPSGTSTFTEVATVPAALTYIPYGNIGIDTSGNLYGLGYNYSSTANGGNAVIWEVPKNGTWSVVGSLGGNPVWSIYLWNGVTVGSDGNLYGVAMESGSMASALWDLTYK